MAVRDATGLTILLVDDHPLFCDAMEMTLSEIFNHPTIYTADSLRHAVEVIANIKAVDMTVLDLNLPDVDGLSGLMRLKQLLPQANIVVVSSLSDNRITTSLMEMGASGFIPKDSSREKIMMAFQAIRQGKVYTPPSYVKPLGRIVRLEQHDILNKLHSLTPQQSKILELICEGKLNKQIAYELSISETTVKAHLTAILRKLNVQNRTQAAIVAKKVSFTSLKEADSASCS